MTACSLRNGFDFRNGITNRFVGGDVRLLDCGKRNGPAGKTATDLSRPLPLGFDAELVDASGSFGVGVNSCNNSSASSGLRSLIVSKSI